MDWYHDTVIAGVLRHLDFGTILAMRRVNKRTLHVANTMFPVDFMKKIKQFMDFGQYSVDVNTPGLLLEQIALNQYLITYIGGFKLSLGDWYDICMCLAQLHGNIRYVPKWMLTPNICTAAVKNTASQIHHVPEWVQVGYPDICHEAVYETGFHLKHICSDAKTEAVCYAAVKNYGQALQYVPAELQREYIVRTAVEKDGFAANYICKSKESGNETHNKTPNNPPTYHQNSAGWMSGCSEPSETGCGKRTMYHTWDDGEYEDFPTGEIATYYTGEMIPHS